MATSEQCCLPLRKKDDAFLKDGRIGSMSPFFDELTHFSPVSHSYRNGTGLKWVKRITGLSCLKITH